jgi:hypothetical protein
MLENHDFKHGMVLRQNHGTACSHLDFCSRIQWFVVAILTASVGSVLYCVILSIVYHLSYVTHYLHPIVIRCMS